MSNDLHTKATRFVSYALAPAIVGIAAALVWQSQPPPVFASDALRDVVARIDVPVRPLLLRPSPRVVVGPVTLVSTPAPKPKPRFVTAVPQKPKTRHCDAYPMYSSGEQKVLICEWL